MEEVTEILPHLEEFHESGNVTCLDPSRSIRRIRYPSLNV